MRRISLALALVGAAAAAGCGGSKSGSNTNPDPGVAGQTFTVSVNVWAGGSVKSQTGTLNADGVTYSFTDDGKLSCTGPNTCAADYAYGKVVKLVPTVAGTNYFNGFAGDCGGYDCILGGNAEKTVIAMFTAKPESHPNWTGDKTVHPTKVGELNCMECHGVALQGVGIAPSCYSCHTSGPRPINREQCTACHPQDIGTTKHQAVYNKYTNGTATGGTTFTGAIGTVTATANTGDIDADGIDDTGTFKLVVAFTLSKGGTGLKAADYTALGQKRISWTKFENGQFLQIKLPGQYQPDGKEKAVSFGAAAAGSTAGNFTTTCAKAPFNPNVSGPANFFYFYFADVSVVPPGGHYFLPDNVISMSKVFGTINWTSTANADGCTQCHGTPYQKHGYRQAVVAGLPDMVACKACHYDNRGGVDFNLAMTSEDPARLAELEAIGAVCGGELCWSAADEETYAYTATTMQDTHISHAKEFLYPQQMSNCATCHAGKLNAILTDANFTAATCKSCHLYVAVNGDDPKRAPKLEIAHHEIDWVKGVLVERGPTGEITAELQCNQCHGDNVDVSAIDPTGTNTPNDGNGPCMFAYPTCVQVPLFAEVHNGFNPAIYNASGVRHTDTITTTLNSASYAADKITFNFTVNGAAGVKPTVVVSLYGYDTKDFIVGGHGSAADGKRNLEWAEGASGNSPRLAVTKQADGSFTAVATLTEFLTKYNDAAGLNKYGTAIKRAELGMLPQVGKNPALPPDNAPFLADGVTVNPAYNPYIAVKGLTKTFDLATGLVDDVDAYGRDIVDPAKCNKCHDALAVEFHSPSYGSAGVVACRLCHIVGSGGSHLEMQSRSIDSYVHAIHSFQAFDVNSINFNDTVANFEYEHHIGSTYPNFTTLSCESCHNPGKYDMPAENRSLPGILSASSTVNKARDIGGISTVVVGPAGRACGGCHRAEAIKKDDATALAQYDQHTATFGIRQGTSAATPKIADVLDNVIASLKSFF